MTLSKDVIPFLVYNPEHLEILLLIGDKLPSSTADLYQETGVEGTYVFNHIIIIQLTLSGGICKMWSLNLLRVNS